MLRMKHRADLSCLLFFVKWFLMAAVVGVVVGAAGAAFAHVLAWVNGFRAAHPKILLALPFGGLVIVALYRGMKNTGDKGTNAVLLAARGEGEVSWKTAPCIFISTALTHLLGGSAGREGAALQLGSSLACTMGKLVKLSGTEKRILTMCGMAAGFSALFGTPMAAAVFALEAACVGLMQYSALFPCVIASVVAHFVAEFMQVPPEVFHLAELPTMTPVGLLQIVVLAAAVGGVSILFCTVLHKAEHLYQKVSNPYLRVAIGGVLVIVLAAVLRTGDYLGSGMGIIEGIFHGEGHVSPAAFLLKMFFTAVTLAAGFKGGEIVPSFTIGAAFGFVVGPLLGLPAQLAAACGMAGLFCGVTNCPMTALLIAFELFGFEGMPWYLTAVAVSYLLSGRFSLYHAQTFRCGKTNL